MTAVNSSRSARAFTSAWARGSLDSRAVLASKPHWSSLATLRSTKTTWYGYTQRMYAASHACPFASRPTIKRPKGMTGPRPKKPCGTLASRTLDQTNADQTLAGTRARPHDCNIAPKHPYAHPSRVSRLRLPHDSRRDPSPRTSPCPEPCHPFFYRRTIDNRDALCGVPQLLRRTLPGPHDLTPRARSRGQSRSGL